MFMMVCTKDNCIQGLFQQSVCTLRSSNPYPIRVGLIADVGQTLNSTQTRDHLTASKPDVILNMGDLSYADHVRIGGLKGGWVVALS